MEGMPMTWTISYQIMLTASGPQEVAIGRYESTPGIRDFAFTTGLSAHEARITGLFY
jgi:hypothetical protein